MSELRLVLFDCDGTLVDSAGHIVGAMQQTFIEHGLVPPPDEAVKSIIGLSLPRAIAQLADRAGDALDDIVLTYKRVYRDAVDPGAATEPLFPGILAMLDALATPETLFGVVTGKSRHGLDRIIAGHGLTGRFITTVTADDAASKPAPEMVERALAETGASPGRTIVIGDSSFDIEMARAAGVFAMGVAWGYQPVERLEAVGAHVVAKTVGDIPGLVNGLVAP